MPGIGIYAANTTITPAEQVAHTTRCARYLASHSAAIEPGSPLLIQLQIKTNPRLRLEPNSKQLRQTH